MNLMQDKIDIVYIWVDGSDSIWKQKRKESYESIQDTSILSEYANVDGRFRDNGELKYSLRSLEKYFPDHWNIYIITDDQIPSFLKKDSDIQIISHRDFIPNDKLPTFSSRKIEAFVPFIESISDTFMLMNDDMFIWPEFSLDDFITQDKIISYFNKEKEIDITESITYSDYTTHILRKKYPRYSKDSCIPCHAPKMIIKQEYMNMIKEFSVEFQKLSQQIFREKLSSSLVWDLYSRWMIHHNKWIDGWNKWLYISTSGGWYDVLIQKFNNLPFFCINDTSDNDNQDSSLLNISQVLEKLFPNKSSFEK